MNKSICPDDVKIIVSTQRVLVLRYCKEDTVIDILNVYGPAVKAERGNFLPEINNIINKLENNNLIICGDFNSYISNEFDNTAGRNHDTAETRRFSHWVETNQLTDAWRHFHSESRDFTWSR